MQADASIKEYFGRLDKRIEKAYALAEKARSQGKDPEKKVDIPIAEDLAARCEGLVGMLYPQLMGSGLDKGIRELEKEYGKNDERVALKAAEYVAKEKYCTFDSKSDACDAGIRIGVAYMTLAVVTAPLEGIVKSEIRTEGQDEDYLAICFAGPIRSAGGTASAMALVVADYVRRQMGVGRYKPTDMELERYATESEDYERLEGSQYQPKRDESKMIVKNCPVCMDGDPTLKFEVSNYKDIPRIHTNQIRGGMCLTLAMTCLKAKKVHKRIKKFGKDFGLEDWLWIEDYLKLQTSIYSEKKKNLEDVGEKPKYVPNTKYVSKVIAGRPVFAHPSRQGGFRLRYGRSRTAGMTTTSFHPATFAALDDFAVIGTQLACELPGKGTSGTICSNLETPVIKLDDGEVRAVSDPAEIRKLKRRTVEILSLGDILVPFGEFVFNNHVLLPASFCEEWWSLEVKKALEGGKKTDIEVSQFTGGVPWKNPSFEDAMKVSKELSVPLHPAYNYFWHDLEIGQLKDILKALSQAKTGNGRAVLPNGPHKRALEIACVPHKLEDENIVLEASAHIYDLFGKPSNENLASLEAKITDDVTDSVSALAGVEIKKRGPTRVGLKMGRPEKAERRMMKGRPQLLFPCGEEGGRMRNLLASCEKGYVNADVPVNTCEKCGKKSYFNVCADCGVETRKQKYCRKCGKATDADMHCEFPTANYKRERIDIKPLVDAAAKRIGMRQFPTLLKSVRGLSGKNKDVEMIEKGLLRAKYDLYTFKDGTVRYDSVNIPLTHVRPKEMGVSVEKLKEIGYTKDYKGEELTSDDQLLELLPQDILVSDNKLFSGADYFVNVAKYVDELLEKVYNLPPFYNIKKKEDLVGELVIGLAPHTSAGIIGRIVGFTPARVGYAHPYWHAAKRRDCFGGDTYIPLLKDGVWRIEKIRDVVESLNPTDVVDDFGTREIKVNGFDALGPNKTGSGRVAVRNFTKHSPAAMIRMKTRLGRVLETTADHKHVVFSGKKESVKKARQLSVGDTLAIPYRLRIQKNDIKQLDLLELLRNKDWVMVRGLNEKCSDARKLAREYFKGKEYDNYARRDSYPISFVFDLKHRGVLKSSEGLFVSAKRDNVRIPAVVPVNEEFLQLVGLYVAEGYSRRQPGMLYQMYIAAEDKDVRSFVSKNMKKIFGLVTTENKKDRLTYSSRILYELFANILECGSSAYEKRIPPRFLNLPDKKLGYLLSGYFEGDGSVSKSDLRVSFDTVSEGLLRDMDFVFGQLGIFVKNYTYTSAPGARIREFYLRKRREVPKFTVTKGIIQSAFVKKFANMAGFISRRKRSILAHILEHKKSRKLRQDYDKNHVYDEIVCIEGIPEEESYCLNVDGHRVVANSLLSRQCDGDEDSILLLMDSLLNFSRQFLPDTRGGRTMDAPLVLTTHLNPEEIDDEAWMVDSSWHYPLAFYYDTYDYKYPYELTEKIPIAEDLIGKDEVFHLKFTHDTDDINDGPYVTKYVNLEAMTEKVDAQLGLGKRIRAVDENKVAELILEKHFLKDIKGNLRTFSRQSVRCVACNQSYRRVPLVGKCKKCGGKLVLTVSEGAVRKYIEPAKRIMERFKVSTYLMQQFAILERRADELFGKKARQLGLDKFGAAS